LIEISSTSKLSVELGGIGPTPRLPNPRVWPAYQARFGLILGFRPENEDAQAVLAAGRQGRGASQSRRTAMSAAAPVPDGQSRLLRYVRPSKEALALAGVHRTATGCFPHVRRPKCSNAIGNGVVTSASSKEGNPKEGGFEWWAL